MKKLMIFLLAIVMLCLVGCDQGSVFNSKQLQPDAVTRIDSAGWDMRIYEFTPETAPGMQCVFVAGERKGGLACFPKSE